MKQPTFFISSTIFDFRDLRSAVKYHLEKSGCVVLASEFNDFRKPLDQHSYEACLQAIEQADYFMLMIGGRVGGWYDEANRVSITQQEYRHAYRLHKAGRVKILTLVRNDVWSLRENHRALESHLKGLQLPDELARVIARYPSKFAEDADFIVRFIDEVGRSSETKAATKSGAALPSGNWIHSFSNFREIADVLNGLLLSGLPVDQATFRLAVRNELIAILRTCLVRFPKSGALFHPHVAIEAFTRDFQLTKVMVSEDIAEVPTKTWDRFASVMLGTIALNIVTHVLPSSLSSPAFMEFDAELGSFRSTEVLESLHELEREIRSANRLSAGETLVPIYANTPRARGGAYPPTLTLRASEVAMLLSLAYRWANIISHCVALVRHLDGAPYRRPKLFPWSPVQGLQEELEREKASSTEVEAFVRSERADTLII